MRCTITSTSRHKDEKAHISVARHETTALSSEPIVVLIDGSTTLMMKTFAILCMTLLSPVLLVAGETVEGDATTTHLKKRNDLSPEGLKMRQLKGGKGSGKSPKSSKSSKNGAIEVFYLIDEFIDAFKQDDDRSIMGRNGEVPLYDADDEDEQVGTFSQVLVSIGEVDTLNYAVFDLDEDDPDENQVFAMYTFKAEERAIVGGTGDYRGANGKIEVGDEEDGRQYLDIFPFL